MKKKKQKKRGVYLKSIKQKEGLEEYVPIKGRGLKLQWINFIKEYIKNGGNATEAYMVAYPKANRETARRNGSKLLTQTDIIGEISNHYDQESATESWVISSARKYVVNGLKDPKWAYAGVKALEMIAKNKGMLTDTKKFEFTAENPAVFLSPYTKEEAEKFRKMSEKKRIFE